MAKPIITVNPMIELIAIIFNQIAYDNNIGCPKVNIEAYFIYVKNRLAPPEPGKVVSILKLGKNQSPAVRKREHVQKIGRTTLSLKTKGAVEPIDISSLWISEISPVLTDSILNELTSLNALELLLGESVARREHQNIQQFAKRHTQQLNPFIIMLVLTIERIAGSDNNRNGRRATIDRYVQGLFEKLGPELTNIAINEECRALYSWNEPGQRWVLPKEYIHRSPENIMALWNSLTNAWAEQSPELYNAAFDKEVLRKLLGEDTAPETIEKVIQFAKENAPVLNKPKNYNR